jgi:glycerol-3-phosphate acyltransferase PlsY
VRVTLWALGNLSTLNLGLHLTLLHSKPDTMLLWISILALAYLLGSIPFGYLLVLAFRHQDVRATGSGNIGATNVARSGGKGLGLLTLFLDALKGFVACAIAAHFAPRINGAVSTLAVAAGVVVVLGHVFPIWLRFKGGKGIATALGVFLALVPWVGVAALGLFIVIVALTRYVSLASIAGAISIPFFTLLFYKNHTPALLIGLSTISLVSIAKHHANIRRLLNGTESKFGKSSSTSEEKNEAA